MMKKTLFRTCAAVMAVTTLVCHAQATPDVQEKHNTPELRQQISEMIKEYPIVCEVQCSSYKSEIVNSEQQENGAVVVWQSWSGTVAAVVKGEVKAGVPVVFSRGYVDSGSSIQAESRKMACTCFVFAKKANIQPEGSLYLEDCAWFPTTYNLAMRQVLNEEKAP